MEELKRVLSVYNKCFFFAAIFVIAGCFMPNRYIQIGLIVVGAIIAFYGVNYKDNHWLCPHCKKPLPKGSEIPDHCPHCRKKIQ